VNALCSLRPCIHTYISILNSPSWLTHLFVKKAVCHTWNALDAHISCTNMGLILYFTSQNTGWAKSRYTVSVLYTYFWCTLYHHHLMNSKKKRFCAGVTVLMSKIIKNCFCHLPYCLFFKFSILWIIVFATGK
jgi:hypothetical protein